MEINHRNIFVIGDSISIHYGPYLEKMISDTFCYNRKGGLKEALIDLDNPVGSNAGDSKMVLKYLTDEFKKNTKYDVLLINCGLHDIRVDRESNKKQVSENEYICNLDKILNISKRMAHNIFWIESTPIIDSLHNSRKEGFLRFSKDVEKYNKIAQELMLKNNIPVIPLYKFTKKLGGKEVYSDHAHFTKEIRMLQAAFITGFLYNFFQK